MHEDDPAKRDVLSTTEIDLTAEEIDGDPISSLHDYSLPVSVKDPLNYKDAHSRSSAESVAWSESEDKEWFDNIIKNNVVRPILKKDLPEGSAVLRSMLVYKVKRSGEFKTRCVLIVPTG